MMIKIMIVMGQVKVASVHDDSYNARNGNDNNNVDPYDIKNNWNNSVVVNDGDDVQKYVNCDDGDDSESV